MLTKEERQQITEALSEWASSAPNEPMVGILGGRDRKHLLTPREIVENIRENTPDGQAVLEVLEHGVRREGIKAVVERLSRPIPR